MGNQLFQIAAAYAYAKEYGFQLVFKDSWQSENDRDPIWSYYFFDDIKTLPMKLIPAINFNKLKWDSIKESSFLYRDLPFHFDSNKSLPFVMLNGYFQSSKYFNRYAKDLRSILQIHPRYIEKARASLSDAGIRKDHDGWIGAHVRRGDYINGLHAPIHSVTNAAYFRRARAKIQDEIGLRGVCWITDDIDWVYKNVYEQGDVVQSSDRMTDFASLSLFRHTIMSNSTFSWWAVWLNPLDYESRKICCPSKWFGPRGPSEYETIYEPEWVRVDTDTNVG